jgi:hypothetical protein
MSKKIAFSIDLDHTSFDEDIINPAHIRQVGGDDLLPPFCGFFEGISVRLITPVSEVDIEVSVWHGGP